MMITEQVQRIIITLINYETDKFIRVQWSRINYGQTTDIFMLNCALYVFVSFLSL